MYKHKFCVSRLNTSISYSSENVKDEGCGEGLLPKNEVDENVLNNFPLGAQFVPRIYPQVPAQV